MVAENIKFFRKHLGMTQEQLAQKLQIKRSLLGAYEEGRADPRLSNLQKMARLFEVSVDNLIGRDCSRMRPSELRQSPYERGNTVLAVSVDETNREFIELVPQKAAAGYLNGFADPEYIRELPRFRLPMLADDGTYRAFEISGDSMLPIEPGTIIIGTYLDHLKNIKNGKTYVLVTKKEGVVYKRVFDYLEDSGKLFLVSDNTAYAPFQVEAQDVMEAWEAKAFISVSFPDGNKGSGKSNVDELAAMVMELKSQMQELKGKPSV